MEENPTQKLHLIWQHVYCILLGIASKVPVLIEVKNLNKKQRPESDDPDFWKVWTHEEPREINWDTIVNDWLGNEPTNDETDKSGKLS